MALRFPKNSYVGAFRAVAGLTNSSVGLVNPRVFQDNVAVPIAPSRYSNVRKVIVSMVTGKLTTGDGTFATCRLGTRTWTSSAPTLSLETFNLPFSSVVENSPDYGMRGTANYSFTKLGAETTIVNAGVTALNHDQAQIIQIVYDRFNPDSADFFAAWDSITDDDTYMVLKPLLQVTASDASSLTAFAMRFHNMQVTVLQAPGNPNNSNTDFAGFTGMIDIAEGTTAFLGLPTTARHVFSYFAEDWNGIESISAIYYGAGSSGTALNIRVNDVTTGLAVFTEAIVIGADGFYVARSQDFSASLVDGHTYSLEHTITGATGIVFPRGTGFFSLVQKAFTKTACIHNITNLSAIPTSVGQSDIASCLFDPTWYEDFTDAQILKNKIFSQIINTSGTDFAPDMDIRSDTNVLSDDSARASGTAVTISPAHTPTESGSLPASVFLQFEDILTNDPINLAGQRKLTKSYPGGGAWGDDVPGGAGLYYALDVPLTELPELGPLFELGAFNPEGCASTSAGLGDHPGLLVITNGQTIPQHFNPIAGVVENNSVPTPFCDEVPQATAQDAGISPDNGLQLGTYTYRYTLRNCCTGKESDPNPDDIVVDTSGQAPAAQVTLSFAGVRIPGDDQICEICIYRTVVGGDFPIMAKVGCFDPELTTIFVDTVADTALDFINDGLSLLNGVMPCVPVVAEFRNRLFGMGDIPDLSPAGSVSVVNGSDIVTGDNDVEWDRCLERKFIKIAGDCRTYEIEKVLPPLVGLSPPIARLKLVDEYEGVTDTDLSYIICGRPNRLYFCEPLEPECWPASLFLDIEPGDGDRLMGAISNFNSLVICKRNKTYVLAFNENPAIEVVVPTRISSDIGCIGPRTFAQVESGSVWLSDRGVAIYDGRSVRHLPESDQMNELFIDPENPNYVRRDANGRVLGAVGVFYPKREQYLLLLPTVKTVRGANLMLVWDVKLQNITLLEFCQEFMSMVVAKDSEGNERVYLGDTNGFTWIYDIGDNDGVGFPNATGTVQGTVSSAGTEAGGASFLDDSSASFITGGLPGLAGLSGVVGLSGAFFEGELGVAGVCVFTRAAGAPLDTPWKHRTGFASTSNRIYVTPGWGADEPAEGDDYMLGPIEFISLFKPMNYGTDDTLKRNWRQVLTHDIEAVSSQIRVELLPDLQLSDPEELTVLSGEPPATGAGRVFDMSQPRGRQVHPVGRLIHNYMGVRITNFAPEQPIRLLNHELAVTPKISK